MITHKRPRESYTLHMAAGISEWNTLMDILGDEELLRLRKRAYLMLGDKSRAHALVAALSSELRKRQLIDKYTRAQRPIPKAADTNVRVE